jgi:hypothetical protein
MCIYCNYLNRITVTTITFRTEFKLGLGNKIKPSKHFNSVYSPITMRYFCCDRQFLQCTKNLFRGGLVPSDQLNPPLINFIIVQALHIYTEYKNHRVISFMRYTFEAFRIVLKLISERERHCLNN